MDPEITPSGQVTVVASKGDLDAAAMEKLRRTLRDLIDQGKTRLVVDLGRVRYIESAGLGELVAAMKRARQAGGDLRLCDLQPDVLRIFEMTWLNRAMLLYPTRGDAVASWA